MSRVWEQHGHHRCSKGRTRRSDFVQLIDIVQSHLDQKYRQHTINLAALSLAVWRALAEGPKGRTNSREGTKGSGRKKAGV